MSVIVIVYRGLS